MLVLGIFVMTGPKIFAGDFLIFRVLDVTLYRSYVIEIFDVSEHVVV